MGIFPCCRRVQPLMRATMPCVPEGTNLGGAGSAPVTLGRSSSAIGTSATTTRRISSPMGTQPPQRRRPSDHDDGTAATGRRGIWKTQEQDQRRQQLECPTKPVMTSLTYIR